MSNELKSTATAEITEAEKTGAFKRWTQRHAQIWQFIKFFLFSSCSGIAQSATYILLGSFLLIPLAAKSIGAIHWWIFHYDSGMLYDLVAYFASATVGNMISFVLNRKKTFKSAKNVTYSITATLIMIVFIICVCTYFGPKLNVALGDLFPALNGSEALIGVRNFIGQCLMSMLSFVFVFLMDKFVILPESKKAKAERKAKAANASQGAASITKAGKIVNEPLAKGFQISALVVLITGAAGLAAGNILYYSKEARSPDTAVIILLIAGSILLGVGEILFSAFVAEKMGDEIESEINH